MKFDEHLFTTCCLEIEQERRDGTIEIASPMEQNYARFVLQRYLERAKPPTEHIDHLATVRVGDRRGTRYETKEDWGDNDNA